MVDDVPLRTITATEDEEITLDPVHHYGETLNVLRPAATTLGVPEVRYPYEIGSVSILNTTPGTMNVREKEVLQDGIPGLEEDLQALLRVIVNVVNAFD